MPPKRKKSLVDSSAESPTPDDNFDVASIASIPSTASATPVKSKAKKPKVEKGEKVEKAKAPPKAKASIKEKVPLKDKEVKGKGVVKEVKETKENKEAKDTKVIGKDGKEKIKAVTGDEAQEVLLEYLSRENRPFSAGDISGNLHGKVCIFLLFRLVYLVLLLVPYHPIPSYPISSHLTLLNFLCHILHPSNHKKCKY